MQAVIWQTRPMLRLHVQVELSPRAEGHSADCTSGLLVKLHEIVLVLPLVLAALLRQQPVLVQHPLLPMRSPPVCGHLVVGEKLLPAVCAGGGAAEGLVVDPHVFLHGTGCVGVATVLARCVLL